MVDMAIRKLFGAKVSTGKYVSEFVKRQQAINATIVTRLVWDSSPHPKEKRLNGKGRPRGQTYIRKVHGQLL